MNKQEAIEHLEAVVAEYDYRKGVEIAGELEEAIQMEPTGWETAENAIIWQGFRIYRSYIVFGSGYTISTDVTVKDEKKKSFGRVEEYTRFQQRVINTPRDMLNILRNDTPWEER